MFDLIIKNGKIIDGSGSEGYFADIGIIGERIEKIGELDPSSAQKIIDAEGSVVTPGFIDMHSHGDLTSIIYPKHENNLKQGVTTYVGGNCGCSIAPLYDYWVILYIEMDILQTDNPYAVDILPLDEIKGKFENYFNVKIDWKSFPEYMNSMEKRPQSTNYVPVIGHGQVRTQVMGNDYKRPANKSEIKKMQEIIAEAMEAGAFGIGTGRDYIPGFFADFNELLEISKPVFEKGGFHTTHWMRTGLRVGTSKPHRKIDGIIEMLELSKQLGGHVHLGHLSPGYSVYPSDNAFLNEANAKATLNKIDEYNKMGAKVTFDVIPNSYGGIVLMPDLAYTFTKWLLECKGSAVEMAEKFKDEKYKKDVMDFINLGQWYAMNPLANPEWDRTLVVSKSKNKDYIGKSIYEISKTRSKDSVETAIDLVADEFDIKVHNDLFPIEVPKTLLNHPDAMPSSDGIMTDLQGPWKTSAEYPGLVPSPNGYCYSIKYLNEFDYPSFENAIRKLTGRAADVLGLNDRGYIKEGAFADILVFGPNNLKTNENVAEPCHYPEGIDYVLVNGSVTIEEGEHTGAFAGKVIRKGK